MILLILTFGFGLATLLGYLTERAKLSSLVGYLIAGYIIGPYSPGITVDLKLSEQLAEIGVILMLFGVGLHFNWEELFQVKYVAIPGAILQTVFTTLATCWLCSYFDWRLESSIVLGVAIGVASTVVLLRVIMENKLIHTLESHLAVGWLIVEDLSVVAVLLTMPLLSEYTSGKGVAISDFVTTLAGIWIKFIVLVFLAFSVVKKLTNYIFGLIAKTDSTELFTICVLAVIFIIAVSAFYLFGVSLPVGAFLAGMVIKQTDAHQKALEHTAPIKDAFMVVFFLSIGMLFNPEVIFKDFLLLVGTIGIIIVVKPLIAFVLTLMMKQSLKTAAIVGIGMAQIGEFSFIMSEEGSRLHILPDEGYDVIVAAAIISIALNPVLFRHLMSRLDSNKPLV